MTTLFIKNYGLITTAPDFKWKDISARPNERFGRYDLLTKYASAAVEQLNLPLDLEKDPHTALIMQTGSGCCDVDLRFHNDKKENPPSPLLFTYTLPSVALGEIAIRYRLTGGNLTLLSDDPSGAQGLLESYRQLQRGECEQLIFIMANGFSEQTAPFRPETKNGALALLLTSREPESYTATLTVEKLTQSASQLLPAPPLLDYLGQVPPASWQTVLPLGNNVYKFTIPAIIKR